MSGPVQPLRARPTSAFAAMLLLITAGAGRAAPVVVTAGSPMSGVLTSPLPAGGSVTISGHAAMNYDGEGYVVGPQAGGTVTPFNLTAYNGLPFLINDRFGSGSDRITMEFNFPLYSISFDYEIFPNANVADGRGKDQTATRNWPDFTFTADGVVIFRKLAEVPGTNGGYTVSPNSFVRGRDEYAPQFVGPSGTISLPGVTRLEFIDWPPVIGVNNIQFNLTTQAAPVPEPASLAALGLGLAVGVGGYHLRRRPRGRPHCS